MDRRSPLIRFSRLVAALAPLALVACDGGTAPPDPPGAPLDLTAVPLSTTSIRLRWSEGMGEVASVEIERAREDEVLTPLATVDAGTRSFDDGSLEPGTRYRYRIRACNDGGCSPFSTPVETVTFNLLTVLTRELPPGVEAREYAAELVAQGGDGIFTWELAGGELPPGLVLDPEGSISGTPGDTGTFAVTFGVQSGDAQSATADLAIAVFRGLEVVTGELPGATVGEPYSEALQATGGDGSFTWERVEGALPEGLTLSPEGIVSGTPQREEAPVFTVQVTSGDGQSARAELSIAVVASGDPGALTIRTALLPPALVGGAYDVVLRTTGGDGSGVDWSVAQGSLPEGLDLVSHGRIQGTPAGSDTASVTLRAASGEEEDTAVYTLIVVEDDPGAYDLTPVNVVPVSPEIQEHVDQALTRWEEAITGDLVTVGIGPQELPLSACAGYGEAVAGTTIDDVIVLVNIGPIDGEGGILGLAGPCVLRDGNLLPVAGVLTLDVDDLSDRVGTRNLTDLIFHEIGHVLGFGPLWSSDFFDLVEGSGTDDPRFTGPSAIERFEALGRSGTVPLENDGGAGTTEVHWEESVFDEEIMTGFTERVGVEQPLSEVTIGSMEDLGYEVDLGAADPFTLEEPAALAEERSVTHEDGERWGYDVLYEGPVYIVHPGSSPGSRRPSSR